MALLVFAALFQIGLEAVYQILEFFFVKFAGFFQILVLPLVVFFGLVGEAGDDFVGAEGGFGGVFDVGGGGAEAVEDAG